MSAFVMAMHRAAHARLARIRGGAAHEDGFALIFVLLITMIITIGVSSVLVVTAGNILPARQSQDSETAFAAAQAGIEDYVAYLNKNCTVFGNTACSSISGTPVSSTVLGADSSGTATFTRSVVNAATVVTDGFVRVKSTGNSNGVQRTLIADVEGLPNILRFSYLSQFETLSSNFLNSYYPARNIKIPTAASASAGGVSTGTVVHWNAPTASGLGGVNVCDKLWYNDAVNSSSTTSSSTQATDGRSTLKGSIDASVPTGTDWSAASTTSGVAAMYLPCEVTFTTGMKFTGPVYTMDAPYLSSGTPTGGGPTFQSNDTGLPPFSTAWLSSDTPAATIPYRTFPFLPTLPSSDSTGYPSSTIQSRTQALSLPSNADDAKGGSTCVYTGPTRVKVSGNTATVISPLTTSAYQTSTNPACYTNTNASITGTGVTSAQVPINGTTIYVQNLGDKCTSYPQYSSCYGVASSSNPIFSLGTPTSSSTGTTTYTATASDAPYAPATGDNPSTKSDGAWTPQWTSYTSGASCNTSTALADLKFFNCSVTPAVYTGYSNAYSWVKAHVQSDLAANASSYTGASAVSSFTTLVNNLTKTGNSADSGNANPTNFTNVSHRWNVSAVSDATTTDGCTPSSSSSPSSGTVAAPTSDPLFTTTATGSSTTTTTTTVTCLTATVKAQSGTCNVALVLGACVNLGNYVWGNGTALSGGGQSVNQFKVTAKITQVGSSTTVTATVVGYPNSLDITQYPTANVAGTRAPGDLYVEGTGLTKSLSLIAENDAVVTGPLTTSYTTGTSTYGNAAWASGGSIALVADNNVRIYHPVSCATAADANTTAGFCPNDITGMYTGGLETNGTLSSTHPAMQYCNMTTGASANTGNSNCSGVTATGSGAVTQIDAAVFALNGSLETDNYNRGIAMGNATVVGGIYQKHRGGTGQQWETQSSDTSRASSGYTLQDTFLDLETSGIPYVPALVNGSNSRGWNVVSISAGTT